MVAKFSFVFKILRDPKITLDMFICIFQSTIRYDSYVFLVPKIIRDKKNAGDVFPDLKKTSMTATVFGSLNLLFFKRELSEILNDMLDHI